MTRKAENLEEMVHILLNNLTTLESVSNFKAACVGHKYVNSDRTEERSIIVFVGQKEHQDIVQNLVPKTLTYKELFCRTDVIQAASPLLSSYSQKINAQNEQLAKELQNMPNVVVGGVAIGDDSGFGTCACIVESKETGKIYALSNEHVIGTPSNSINLPKISKNTGKSAKSTKAISVSESFNFFSSTQIEAIIDCAIAEIDPQVAKLNNVEIKSGIFSPKQKEKLGPVLIPDYTSFDLLGRHVYAVGASQGYQEGEIVGIAYTYKDNSHGKMLVNDFLIVGMDKDQYFSYPGDSGKLILTKDTHQPVALLWGGVYDNLFLDRPNEKWSYGIQLSKVLKYLKVSIYEQ